MAEWLGRALQKLVQRFESASDLQPPSVWWFFLIPPLMRILLVAATSMEIQPLLKEFEITYDVGNFNIFQKQLSPNLELHIGICGVGIHHTAFHLGRTLMQHNYDMAIQAGICGSFSEQLPIGATVEVIRETLSEFGAESNGEFIPASALQFNGDGASVVVENTIENTSPTLEVWQSLPKTTGITVNTVHGNASSIHAIRQRLNPDIETMEGFAFFYGCRYFQLPFYQVRTVSNFIEPRNTLNWNIPLAVENLNNVLCNTLYQFSDKWK